MIMQNGMEHTNKSVGYRLKISIIFLLLVAACTVVGWQFFYNKSETTLDSSKHNTSFSVYFPQDLPAGFKLDETSISRQSKVTGYQITDPKGKTIFVAQQPLPEKTVTEKFEKETLVFPEKVTSPLGEAVYGSANGQLIGSIKAQKTWILVTADKASEESLAAVMVSISVVR